MTVALAKAAREQMATLPPGIEPAEAWRILARQGWVTFLCATAATEETSYEAALVDSLYVFAEFGAGLAPGPFALVAAALVPLLELTGSKASLPLQALEEGAVITAPLGIFRHGDQSRLDFRLTMSQPTAHLSGRLENVPWAADASFLVLPVVNASAEAHLVTLPTDHHGVTITRTPTIDSTVDDGEVLIDATLAPAQIHTVDRKEAAAGLRAASARYSVALDAMAIGGSKAMIDRTAAHLSSRQQFGHPIGSFQALKHTAADMLADHETARALARQAGTRLLGDPAGSKDTTLLDLMASRIHSSRCAIRTAERAIQCFGAMGFTWELGLHRWYRRALLDSQYSSRTSDLRTALRRWIDGTADLPHSAAE